MITLPKAVMIGSAGGQRPVITPLDFPNVNLGWFIRPALDVTKPIGPYKYFIRVYNPITREIEFWALYGDSITHSGYLFFPVGTKDGWYNSFLQDGKEIEGNELFKEYLLITEDSPDGFT
ncbi:hypothetical protein HYT17_01195 [Candidatus Microgenomates bacterium]|nr:hypothetical protein [Candidatus Microgenomates bacterium]